MIFNLLNSLTDPDDIPSGYTQTDMSPVYTLAITIIAIAVTIISAIIIYLLYRHSNNEKITSKTWIPYTIAIIAIVIIALLATFCSLALN